MTLLGALASGGLGATPASAATTPTTAAPAPTTTTRAVTPTTTTTRPPASTTTTTRPPAPTTTTTRPPASTTTTRPATTATSRPPAPATTTTLPARAYTLRGVIEQPDVWWPWVEPNRYVGALGRPTVAIVGDSLTYGISDALSTALVQRGYRVSVTAHRGYPTWRMQHTLERLAQSPPRILVLALGTNDLREMAWGTKTAAHQGAAIAAALKTTTAVPCVVWIGVNTYNGQLTNPPTVLGDMTTGGPIMNKIIRNALAASGRDPARTRYGDWATASAGRGSYFRSSTDVHLTATGNTAYRQLMVSQIDACRRALGA